MALTLDDLFASPDHYLHSFDGNDAIFVPMDRDAYHRSVFLDGRISPAGNGSMRLPVAPLLDRTGPPQAIGWIFHVAHCGSTLLARALDEPGMNLVLREPLALRQVAVSHDTRRLALVMAQLSKRYRSNAATIVKANVPVNFLLPEIAAYDLGCRALFLYADLSDYLLAILRSDDHRAWLRLVTTQLASYLGDLTWASDAERAGALWLAQMRAYDKAIAGLANARSLEAETFFGAPQRVLSLAARHLGVPLSDADVKARVTGPLFNTYSKNPDVAFDNQARLARRAELERVLAAELEQAREWIGRTAGGAELVVAPLVAARLES